MDTIPKLYGKNPECFVSLLGGRSVRDSRGVRDSRVPTIPKIPKIPQAIFPAGRAVDTGLTHAHSAAVLPVIVGRARVYIVGATGRLTLGHLILCVHK